MRKSLAYWVPFLFVIDLSADEIEKTVNFSREQFKFRTFKEYDLVSLERATFTNEVGNPVLPCVPVSILIPSDAIAIEVETVSFEKERIKGSYNIFPKQPPRPLGVTGQVDLWHPSGKSSKFVEPNSTVYNSSSPYPSEIIKLTGTGCKSGYRLAQLLIYPIQYIPDERTLLLYSQITFKIRYKPYSYKGEAGLKPALTATQKRIMEESLRRIILNPEDIPAFAPNLKTKQLEEEEVQYCIIAPQSFVLHFQPLVDWKTDKGIPTRTVTTEWIYSNYSGIDNQEKIRNFVKDANESWGTIWFLLGGDWEFVPHRMAWIITTGYGADYDTIPCDVYYSNLDGDWDANHNGTYGEMDDTVDLYSDIYVGRASVESPLQCSTFVNKTLTYEKNPPAGYTEKILLLGEELWPDYHGDFICDSIANTVPASWAKGKLYQSQGNLTTQGVSDSLNAGFGFCHYAAHGNPNGTNWFGKTEADLLTNNGKLGIHNAICCLIAAFDNSLDTSDCFVEHMMNNPNGGTVAFMGNSRFGWGNPPEFGPSELLDWEFYRKLIDENIYRVGNANAASKDYWAPVSATDPIMRWCIYSLTLFGDPELNMWTQEPPLIEANHPDTIQVGGNDFPVAAFSGGFPLQDASVCVKMDTTVYERDTTNSSGNATPFVFPVHPGTLRVTITAHNYVPYSGEVIVLPASGAYVGYLRHTVIDTISPANGDGIINSGEQIQLKLWTKNYGVTNAEGVSGILSTNDTFVTMIDTSEYFGNLPVSDSSLTPDKYEFLVHPNCPDKHILTFILTCKDTLDSTWVSKPTIDVAAPFLAYDDHEIHDAQDGWLDPGETIDMIVILKNKGSAEARRVDAILRCDDSYITITDSTSGYGNILPDSSSSNLADPFIVECSASTPLYREVYFTIKTADLLGNESISEFRFRVGGGEYLVLDLDPNHSSGPVIDSILTTLGYLGDYTAEISRYRAHLSKFNTLFICLGIYYFNYTLAPGEDVDSLCAYLDRGGRVYMEGGDAWTSQTNFHSYFHIAGTDPGQADIDTLLGQVNTFTNQTKFKYTGENKSIDHVEPGNGAWVIFKNTNPGYNSGIAFASGKYKTVGTSFEFAGLQDASAPSTRAALADSIMKWLSRDATHDVALWSIDVPGTFVVPLTPTNPKATVKNLGTTQEIFDVTCTIDSAGVPVYQDTVNVSNLQPDSIQVVGFDPWTPGEAGNVYLATFCVEYADEEIANNIRDSETTSFECVTLINSPYTFSPPTINGNIDTTEWQDAVQVDVSDIEEGFSVGSMLWYVMNDSDALYLGINAICDTTLGDDQSDNLWVFTDDNHDGSYPQWPGPDSSEGVTFLLRQGTWNIVAFVPLSSDSESGHGYLTSLEGALDMPFDHVQYELAISIGSLDEYINASLGDTVGVGIWVYDGDLTPGWWPQMPRFWIWNPATMGDVILGLPPGVEISTLRPKSLALYQNKPNPVKSSTNIVYQLPNKEKVSLKVYNLLGQQVRTLVEAKKEPGVYKVVWDGKDDLGRKIGSGIYFYSLKVSDKKLTKKLILLR